MVERRGFGRRLKDAMVKKNINNVELARILADCYPADCQIHPVTISRWRSYTGDMRPRPDNVERLATVLDCDADWLWQGPADERAADQPAPENADPVTAEGLSELIDGVREIWTSGDLDTIEALRRNIKAFITSARMYRSIRDLTAQVDQMQKNQKHLIETIRKLEKER